MAKTKKKDQPVADLPAVKEQAAIQVTTTGQDLNSWGPSEISSRDIIIPRILLAQPMSDSVTNGSAKFGEFRESLAGELLGDFKKGFNVIPFHMRKVWVEYDVTSGNDMKNKKFLRITPVTPDNEANKYNDEEKDDEGKTRKIMRDYVMEFYVLLESELEVGAGAIPYTISARRSSAQAGKKLATQMYVKNASAGKAPPAVTLEVTAKKESNDQGTFAVWDVAPVKPTDARYQGEAFKWFQMVRAGAAKVDETAYAEEASEGVQHAKPLQADGPEQF